MKENDNVGIVNGVKTIEVEKVLPKEIHTPKAPIL